MPITAVPPSACVPSSGILTTPGPAAKGPLTGLNLRPIYQSPQFTIVCDDGPMSTGLPLSAADGAKLAELISKAYAFDQRTMGWTAHVDQIALASPFTVAVLSRSAREQKHWNNAGGTLDASTFMINDKVLTEPDEYAGVAAHELSHMQNMRIRKGAKLTWPGALNEGLAVDLGTRFSLQFLGHPCQSVKARAAYLTKMTRAEAEDAFGGKPGLPPNQTYSNGALFIEFLRTRLLARKFPDALARMGRVVESARDGEDFAQSFQEQFTVPFDDAKGRYLRYLSGTQDNARVRLQDTPWAGLADT